jgi:DNA-binding MarR family transcriptional regulator
VGDKHVDGLPPAAALLRRPAVIVRHEIMNGLATAGYTDILPAHLGVLQHPGPDGQRPGILAARTLASKQAMNHLLHQLEAGGYLVREASSGDRRTRVVRLTERGWDVLAVIRQTELEVEKSWAEALGQETYRELRHGLTRLEEVTGTPRG